MGPEATKQYSLYDWQQKILKRLKRFNVLVIPRQHGKSELFIYIIVMAATQKPGNYAWIAPQIEQGWNSQRKKFQDHLKMYGLEEGNGYRSFKKEHRIELSNGSIINFMGTENVEAIRGFSFDGIVCDEAQDISDDDFNKIIMPTTFATQGWINISGTPNGAGKNFLYQRYTKALKNPDWFAFKTDIDQIGLFPPDEIERIKREFEGDEESMMQEIYCSFFAGVSDAYYTRNLAKAEKESRITNVPYISGRPVHTAWDIGLDGTAVWFFQITDTHAFNFIDFECVSDTALPDMIRIVQDKPYVYGCHVAGWDVHNRNAGNGLSQADIAFDLGLDFNIAAPRTQVQQRVNAAKMIFPQCYFDKTRCFDGIEALRNYQKKVNKDGYSTHKHTWASHPSDAFGHACLTMDDIIAAQTTDYSKFLTTTSRYNPLA